MTAPGFLAAALLVLSSPGPAEATVAREAVREARPEPQARTVCSVEDDRLDELSGLAAGDGSRYAVNDGGTRVEVFVLGPDCDVTDVLRHPTDPYDVEDLALGSDGTLWLGDTGDNRQRRDTVALHAVPSGGGEAALYRLTYPGGPRDAEALFLDTSGTPYIITKDVLGSSSIFRPAKELVSPGPTPLEEVGTLSYSSTDTPGGPVGSLSSVLVTGAALSRDGTVLAVRTYTDAYLYPVSDGEVLAALDRQPARIPLPNEPQGEALTFTDNGALLSASEGVPGPLRAFDGATGYALRAGGESANGQDDGRARREQDRGGSGSDTPEAPEDGDGSGLPTLPGIAIAVLIAAVLFARRGRTSRRG